MRDKYFPPLRNRVYHFNDVYGSNDKTIGTIFGMVQKDSKTSNTIDEGLTYHSIIQRVKDWVQA